MGLSENLDLIQGRIRAACERSGRDPGSVSLVAVSKGHPAQAIEDMVDLGQTLFGESKVQEAKTKMSLCPAAARWHLIGHLQTNKCRDAVRLFEMIHSVDGLHLAEAIQKECDKASRSMAVLLQVNVAAETSKFGLAPDQLLETLDAVNALDRLEIHGLMTLAPWTPTPEKVRPSFRKLAELRARCEDHLGAPLPVLSMGMSGDFEVAIEEGATLVRVGTALFGPRSYAKSKPESEP